MYVSAASANTMGVYRMMQGHMSGHTDQQAAQSKHETTKAIIGPTSAGKSQGMAFALQREEALGRSPRDNDYEPVLENRDAIRSGDLKQLNAGSMDMARYLMGVMSGNVVGPMPVSALIASEKYERAKMQLG